MDRKFLMMIAGLIVLVLGAGIAWQIWSTQLISKALVPTVSFRTAPPQAKSAYADPAMWYSRPGMANDPAQWVSAGYSANPNPPAALFFIHPTSFLDRRVRGTTSRQHGRPDTGRRHSGRS